MPISRALARGRKPSASLSVATIGMSLRPESPSHSRTLRPACVESITATTLSCPKRMTPMAVLPWWKPKLPSARITRRRSTLGGMDPSIGIGGARRAGRGVLCHRPCLARRGSAPDVGQAALQQPPLRIRSDELERRSIGDRRLTRPAGAPEEVGTGGRDQVVAGQVDLVEGREARVGTVAEADRDGPVQGDDGVRRLQQGVVQPDDRGPVRLGGCGRRRVSRGDLRLEPVRPRRSRVRAGPVELRSPARSARGPTGHDPAPPSSAARRHRRPGHPDASAAAGAARGVRRLVVVGQQRREQPGQPDRLRRDVRSRVAPRVAA